MKLPEFSNSNTNPPAIGKGIDAGVLSFIKRMTEPYKDDEDIKLFLKILNGEIFQDGKTMFKLRIGSSKFFGEKGESLNPALWYNEFVVYITLTSDIIKIMAELLHNSQNKIELFDYYYHKGLDLKRPVETCFHTGQEKGRHQELYFNEICDLLMLNREIKIKSELNSNH